MKIEREPPRRMTLSAFAEKHDLTMKVTERTRTDLHPSFRYEDMRFYAGFKGVELSVNDGRFLEGTHGDGPTEDAAMAEYARRISGGKLIVDSFKPTRREIYAPELVHAVSEDEA